MIIFRVLFTLVSIGWWGRLGDVWGRKPVLLLACSFLLVLIKSANAPTLLMLSVLHGLFGGHALLYGTLLAYVTDCTSLSSRFGKFSALFAFAYVTAVMAIQLGNFNTLGGQIYPENSYPFMMNALVLTANLLWIATILPESLQTMGIQERRDIVSDFRAEFPYSFAASPLHRRSYLILSLSVFLYSLTLDFPYLKWAYEHLWQYKHFSDFAFFYALYIFGVTSIALVYIYPGSNRLLKRIYGKELHSLLYITKRLVQYSVSLDAFLALLVIAIPTTEPARLVHLFFNSVSFLFIGVIPALFCLASLEATQAGHTSRLTILFGSLAAIQEVGLIISTSFIESALHRLSSTGQLKIMYSVMAAFLILTSMLLGLGKLQTDVATEDGDDHVVQT
ncbi:hypothetical protein IW261DRAFT_367702 [Armillaria novae-zelandiae]|uniref:Major facilitator superfamily (MFS) profile domain-containing protein n=1 Tax=Armillaria novae-zelandiae TaxID=153914 RepID=A0AA39UGR3_9AGAR|nr:hypothetical protein IW261DRAFT_367702 [Armillaria novae-zelandiae]